jgi:hypothetical protein
VAEEGTGAPAPTGQAPDLGWHPTGAAPTVPGWYPTGTNPNEQAYWDGSAWSRTRQWSVTGWVEEGVNPVTVAPQPGATVAPPRYSANPYAPVSTPAAPPRPRAVSSSLTLGMLVLLASGILLMVGSVTSWVTASISSGGHAATIAGVPGIEATGLAVNGYATFICGIVLVALAVALIVADDPSLRLLSLLAAWTSLGFAIYFLVRILQEINDNTSRFVNASVGPGLIVVMCAAVVAAAVTAVRMRSV